MAASAASRLDVLIVGRWSEFIDCHFRVLLRCGDDLPCA